MSYSIIRVPLVVALSVSLSVSVTRALSSVFGVGSMLHDLVASTIPEMGNGRGPDNRTHLRLASVKEVSPRPYTCNSAVT